jgi:[ribosomal protein S5]-alanine N-acetyltransferase
LNIKLETERLKLISLDTSHTALLFDFLTRNAEFFKPWSPLYEDGYFDIENHRKHLLKIEQDTNEGKGIKFGTFLKNDPNKIIGTLSFMNIIYGPFLSCFTGYRTDEYYNGKGFTTEALKCGVDYVFEKLKLHRVEANIIPKNAASIRVVEKLGFKPEGKSEKYLQINGKWEDHLHYVKLNEKL